MKLHQGYHIYDYYNRLDFQSNNICIINTGWSHSPKIENYEVNAEIIFKEHGYWNIYYIFYNINPRWFLY
jgi:hypothetical protein